MNGQLVCVENCLHSLLEIFCADGIEKQIMDMVNIGSLKIIFGVILSRYTEQIIISSYEVNS